MSLWRDFVLAFFSALGGAALLAGLIDVFAPSVLEYNFQVGFAAIVLSLCWATFRAWPRQVIQHFEAGFSVQIAVGDILDGVEPALIGMCDTFDVETPTVIARESLQGQLLGRIYGGDIGAIKAALEAELASVDSIDTVDKPGNQTRFPIGTVVPLSRGDRTFYCVAYSSMDERNVARASVAGITSALYATWESVNQRGNGEYINVPLVGQGQSRLNVLTPDAALRLIALTYVLRANEERVGAGLRIVLRPSDVHKVNQREFAGFLASLPGAVH